MSEADAERLMGAYLDQTLERDEELQLAAWLTSSPDNLRTLARRAWLHAALRELLRAQRPVATASRMTAQGHRRFRKAGLGFTRACDDGGGSNHGRMAGETVKRTQRWQRRSASVRTARDLKAPPRSERGIALPRSDRTPWSVATGPSSETTSTKPAAREVLLVVGHLEPGPGDLALEQRLRLHGFSIKKRQGVAVSSQDARGARLIFISATVSARTVGTRLRAAPVPLITCEPWSFDDLGLTGLPQDADGLTDATQTRLVILAGNHSLAAGLRDTVDVTSAPVRIAWGMPLPSAISIAAVEGLRSQVAIFGYERGSAMAGMMAPARRLVFFLNDDTAALLTEDGWRLLRLGNGYAASRRDRFTCGVGESCTSTYQCRNDALACVAPGFTPIGPVILPRTPVFNP